MVARARVLMLNEEEQLSEGIFYGKQRRASVEADGKKHRNLGRVLSFAWFLGWGGKTSYLNIFFKKR